MAKVLPLSKPTAFIALFTSNPDEAISREKQLKRWKRDWKIELIERDNPEWRDLSDLLV
jgi:predicted GIY-YIG superfamily endonuclease